MAEPHVPAHVTDDYGRHWLPVKDLVKFLKYSGNSKASEKRVISENEDHIKKFGEIRLSDKQSRHSIDQGVIMINEYGIAHWLMRARMPVAEEFKGWFAKNAKIYGPRPILQLYDDYKRGALSEQVPKKENSLGESKSDISFETIICSSLISILITVLIILAINWICGLASRKDIYNDNFVRKMRVS